jgi:hypothetical protein
LAFKIIPRIIKRIDFIHPEGFLVKGIEPQGEADNQTKKEDEEFFAF